MKKLLFLALLSLMAGSVLSACSFRRTKADETEAGIGQESEICTHLSVDELESGNYYILHDGSYYPMYIGENNFTTYRTSGDRRRVAWFSENDIGRIPTMYEGDELIYYSTNPLDEIYNVERFEYLGYTIGISNLKETDSGRYSFSAVSQNANISKDSDAARLMKLDFSGVIIDSIGRTELRSGNVSGAGTIIGLSGNSFYQMEVYAGTELYNYVICADRIAMCGMSSYKLSSYTFLKSTVIRIDVPSYFNSGYYRTTSGMFRYVKGKEYSEDTDFNIENVATKKEQEAEEQKEINKEDNAVSSIDFVVRRSGTVNVVVTYKKRSEAMFQETDPVIAIKSDSVIYTLGKTDENTFSGSLSLGTGRYTLEITGMNGRAYEYTITEER